MDKKFEYNNWLNVKVFKQVIDMTCIRCRDPVRVVFNSGNPPDPEKTCMCIKCKLASCRMCGGIIRNRVCRNCGLNEVDGKYEIIWRDME